MRGRGSDELERKGVLLGLVGFDMVKDAIGELNSIRLCAAESLEPSGEFARPRFSGELLGWGAGRFRDLTLRGSGGDAGAPEATVMLDGSSSSLSSAAGSASSD